VNGKGYRYPELVEGCTGCELCAKVCPDYCFEVYREPAGRREAHSAGRREAN
jgi:formate hydrogenlyase subunit 6/NADH:ubiquinone oxidoreductase subunit I